MAPVFITGVQRVGRNHPVKLLLSTFALLFPVALWPAHAGDLPAGPVHLVVPFAAGGSTDILARVVSLRLGGGLHQPVLVKNMPGHPTVSGAQFVANAAPDGRTFLVVNATLAMNEALYGACPMMHCEASRPFSLAGSISCSSCMRPLRSTRATISSTRHAAARDRNVRDLGRGQSGPSRRRIAEADDGWGTSFTFHRRARRTAQRLVTKNVSCVIVALPRALPYVKSGQLRASPSRAAAGRLLCRTCPRSGEVLQATTQHLDRSSRAVWRVGTARAHAQRADDVSGHVLAQADLVELLGSLGYEPRSSTPYDFQNRLRANIQPLSTDRLRGRHTHLMTLPGPLFDVQFVARQRAIAAPHHSPWRGRGRPPSRRAFCSPPYAVVVSHGRAARASRPASGIRPLNGIADRPCRSLRPIKHGALERGHDTRARSSGCFQGSNSSVRRPSSRHRRQATSFVCIEEMSGFLLPGPRDSLAYWRGQHAAQAHAVLPHDRVVQSAT